MAIGKELSFDETSRIISFCKGDLNKLYYSSDAIKGAMRLPTFKRIIERRCGTTTNVGIVRELLNSDFTNKTDDISHFKHLVSMIYDFHIDRDIFKFERIVRYCQTNKIGDFA